MRGQEVAYEKDSIPKLEEQLQATEQNYEDSKEALKSLGLNDLFTPVH